eukprot:c9454_g1_i2.p1 GENE.c9454_g1_i2~~c9454_g1_i2.p1  ORF type:complete len:353 (+),score=100.15 c9454_g1_i2:61-1119(+)
MADEPPSWFVSGAKKIDTSNTTSSTNDSFNDSSSRAGKKKTNNVSTATAVEVEAKPSWMTPNEYAPAASTDDSVSDLEHTRPRQESDDQDKPSWFHSGAQKLTQPTPKRSQVATPKESNSKTEKANSGNTKPKQQGRTTTVSSIFSLRSREHSLQTRDIIIILSVLSIIIWCVEFGNMANKHKFNKTFGIRPRVGKDIWKIISFVFLHDSYLHVFFTWVPFVILGFVLLFRTGWLAIFSFLISWGVGGIFVWIAGLNTTHVGLEIISSCMWTFCLFGGLRGKSVVMVVSALASGAFSLFLVVGLKFAVSGIRWDSLLYGGIVGFVMFLISWRFCRERGGGEEAGAKPTKRLI